VFPRSLLPQSGNGASHINIVCEINMIPRRWGNFIYRSNISALRAQHFQTFNCLVGG